MNDLSDELCTIFLLDTSGYQNDADVDNVGMVMVDHVFMCVFFYFTTTTNTTLNTKLIGIDYMNFSFLICYIKHETLLKP